MTASTPAGPTASSSELCSGAHPVTSYTVNYILTFLESGSAKDRKDKDRGKEEGRANGTGSGSRAAAGEREPLACQGYCAVLEGILRESGPGRTVSKEALEILAALHRNMEARVQQCADAALKTLFRLNNACHIDRYGRIDRCCHVNRSGRIDRCCHVNRYSTGR